MQKVAKIIWIITVVIAVMALVKFMYLFISDKYKIGPAGPFLLYYIWFPVLLFVVISVVLLIKGKVPVHSNKQIILILFLIIFSLVFSGTLLREPQYEKIMQEIGEKNRQQMEERRQVTVDGKYEYTFYLAGRLTDRPRAHIVIRNLTNNDRKSITIDFNFEGIGAVEELPPSTRLVELSPTDEEHIYLLTSTPYLKEEIEIFEVNMETEMSRKIE